MENIIIDESLARRNKENYSFSDYKEGSATAEYNEVIKDASEQIEAAKAKVSEEAKEKLDMLLVRFSSKYADWTNRHNASGAGHVSSMISGPSNYNMSKHNKWLIKEGKLWEEYNEIKDISSKINKIINGDKIIKSDDLNALDKLNAKLEDALKKHEGYKNHNKMAKQEGKEKLPAYVLTNSNGRIRSIKQRIAHMEKLKSQDTKEIEPVNEVDGIKIVDNVEANRLQIFFDIKPDFELRKILKQHGFRWSPKNNNAWQRFRSAEAERIAKKIISEI